MTLPVLILAGGLATRLKPISEHIPKSLIEISGLPFIAHQINYLYLQGVKEVVICAGYLGEKIQSVIGYGSNFKLNISYSFDGPKLLGTGGALKKAAKNLKTPFFVLYGDSFLPVDYKKIENFYLTCQNKALMTIYKNDNQWDISNVYFKNGELLEYNKINPTKKMEYIDYGLSILSPSVFQLYENRDDFDLSDLYYKLSKNNLLAGFEVKTRFYEIGSLKGIEDAKIYFDGPS